MKSSNLARRTETYESPEQAPRPDAAAEARRDRADADTRRRTAFGHRTIEIRDQGFAPFRVR
jgi:hypothetical protein